MDEQVNIVDEKLDILYQTNKKEAHEKGLLHKTVIANVRRGNGNIVVVKQASDKQEAGLYTNTVGGHVKAGESDEEALKREVLEEIGIKDFEYKFIGKVIMEREIIGRKENHFFMVYEVYTDKELKLNEESTDYITFSMNELKKLIIKEYQFFGYALFFVLKNFYFEDISKD